MIPEVLLKMTIPSFAKLCAKQMPAEWFCVPTIASRCTIKSVYSRRDFSFCICGPVPTLEIRIWRSMLSLLQRILSFLVFQSTLPPPPPHTHTVQFSSNIKSHEHRMRLWFDQLRFDQNDAKCDLYSDLDLYL